MIFFHWQEFCLVCEANFHLSVKIFKSAFRFQVSNIFTLSPMNGLGIIWKIHKLSFLNIILFCFCYLNRSLVTPYLEEMLKQMQELLVVNSPDNGICHSLSESDQLFIYETASTLIVASSIEPEVRRKSHLMAVIILGNGQILYTLARYSWFCLLFTQLSNSEMAVMVNGAYSPFYSPEETCVYEASPDTNCQ